MAKKVIICIIAAGIVPFLGPILVQTLGTVMARVLSVDQYKWFPLLSVPFAIIALIIFLMINNKKYKGCFAKVSSKNGMLWMTVLICAYDVVVLGCMGLAFSGQIPVTFEAFSVALMAAVGEEVFLRVIPVSVLMGKTQGKDRIWLVLIITSLVFSLSHIANIINGQALYVSLLQALFTLALGLGLGAIYLYTGNILLAIIWHFIHDLAVTFIGEVGDSTAFNVAFIIYALLEVAIVVFMLVKFFKKDKHETILELWKDRWSKAA